MAGITFTIPSVLNSGGGEKKVEVEAVTLSEAFGKVSGIMGDEFRRRVLEADGSVRSLINIYINGKNAKFSGGMDTELHDGDDVYVLPAVAGGSELSSRNLDRYSRQIMLEQIGYEGQLKLRGARVCLVGVGGLGNPIASRLVAMGIGTLRLVDRDVIELSNLHRQTLFEEADVGRVKVEAAAEKLRRRNSDVQIEALAVSVNEGTAYEVVEGCDVVIDALDSVNARYALNIACVKKKIPFVTGAAVGVSGQAFTVLPGRGACYYCVFPALDEDTMPTCSIEGVHPPVLSIVGNVEVAEATRIILGQEPNLSGRIMHVDLDSLGFEFTKVARVAECPVCGSGKMPEAGKKEMIIEELCGRNRGQRTFSLTPADSFELDVQNITDAARAKGFEVSSNGELGMSVSADGCTVSLMRRGSAVLVGPKSEDEAVRLYHSIVGR